MSLKKGKHVEKIFSNGLVMHACLGITTDGLPIGLLDQHIFARKLNTKKRRKLADVTPIEEKESYRWLQSLRNAREIAGDTQVVIPARRKTPHGKERAARTALLTIKFGSFLLNPPRNNVKHRTSELPDLPMHAVYVFEVHPPDGAEPVEWMLLTNLRVTHFDEAYEKVLWYCPRWRIEMFFKVLKSGFLVEDCRLGKSDRLAKYLTIMSIVAWRLFMITLIARTDPDTPCTELIADYEWKVLFMKVRYNDATDEIMWHRRESRRQRRKQTSS